MADGGQHVRLGARDDDDDHRRARRGQRVEQRDLPADELERRGRPALADQLDAVADDGDDESASRAAADRLGDQRRRRASAGNDDLRARLAVGEELALRVGAEREDVGAAGVGDGPAGRATWARKPSSTVCDHLARVAVGQPVGLARGAGPVAELGVRVVGVRARSTAIGPARASPASERQRAVVAQQHQRAPGDLEVELGVLGRADDRGLALQRRVPRGPRTAPARTSA